MSAVESVVHHIIRLALDVQHLSIEGRDDAHRVDRCLGSIDPGLGSGHILGVCSILETVIGALGIFQLRLLQRQVILRIR